MIPWLHDLGSIMWARPYLYLIHLLASHRLLLPTYAMQHCSSAMQPWLPSWQSPCVTQWASHRILKNLSSKSTFDMIHPGMPSCFYYITWFFFFLRSSYVSCFLNGKRYHADLLTSGSKFNTRSCHDIWWKYNPVPQVHITSWPEGGGTHDDNWVYQDFHWLGSQNQ